MAKGWTFNRRAEAFQYFDRRGELIYSVQLSRCDTCAEILDWIAQLAGKPWCTNDELGQLLRLMANTLDPQTYLCTQGRDRGRIDPLAIVDKVAERRAAERAKRDRDEAVRAEARAKRKRRGRQRAWERGQLNRAAEERARQRAPRSARGAA